MNSVKRWFLVLAGVVGMFALGVSARAADFTLELPPLPFPPKILDVQDTGAVLGQPMTVTVTARGNIQRRLDLEASPATNFCDETVTPNPPLVQQGYLWYTNATTDELLANWTKVTLTLTNTPADEPGCDHTGAISEFSGQIPSSVFTANDHEIVYYVQVVDSAGNMASQTPDDTAANISKDTTDLQTNPAQAAKAPAGSALINDATGDTKGNLGQGISKPVVDVQAVNAAVGAEILMLNLKIGGGPPSTPDGGEFEGFVAALINGDAVDDDPNDALYPDGTFALSTAFQEVLPDLVHAVWDGRCLTSVAITGGSTDELLGCDLYSGGAGTGMEEKDGNGYLNWTLKHSADGVSLFGANKNVEIVVATGQIDINAAAGTPPFWITDYTVGITYYKKRQVRTVSGDIPPPTPCSTLAVTKSDGGGTNTCTVTWKNTSGNVNMTGSAGYFIYRSTKSNGGASFADLSVLNGASPVAHGAEGAANQYADTGLAKDGTPYYYWCMPRDKDGRVRYPSPGPAPLSALCTESTGCPTFPSKAPWPSASSTAVCQTDDGIPPVDPVEGTASTPAGNTKILSVKWKPGPNASDASMKGSGAGYRVFRDSVLVATKPFVDGVAEFEFIDQNLTNGTTYNYKIVARDVDGNDSTPGLTFTGTPQDKQPPPKPKNTTGFNQSSDVGPKARVQWEFLSEQDAPDFQTYVVYRCETSGPTDDLGDCHDGAVPLATGTWTPLDCPGLTNRGAANEPPSCTDTSIGTPGTCSSSNKKYWYLVTAKDTAGNESGFPDNPFSSEGYPYRAVKVYTQVIAEFIPPDSVRDLTAVDTEEGKTCEVSFKMPTQNKDASAFCANGGTQQYCAQGVTNILPHEVAGYSVAADTSPPISTDGPTCGTTHEPGDLTNPDALIKLKCTGLTNGISYKLDVFAFDDAGCHSSKGDFTWAAVTCTPTDKMAPSAPTEAEAAAFTESSVAVGWVASAPETNGGFKLYVCVADPGAACTTFTEVAGLELTPCGGVDLTGKNYCYEDATTPANTENFATKVFTYKVTAFDAAANESLLSESNAVAVDFSIPAASPTCVVNDNATTGDSVECSWPTYNNSKGAANLVLVSVKCESDTTCNNANTLANWVERTTVAVTTNTGIIAAGLLSTGCYRFAVLGKLDASNKSNPITATQDPASAVCLGVDGPPAPTCELPDCDETIPPAGNPVCVVNDNATTGDSVECSWTAYSTTFPPLDFLKTLPTQWVMVSVACESADSCDNAFNRANWVDRTVLDVSATSGIIPGGALPTGCYRFAILRKKGVSKSNPITATQDPATTPVCREVDGPPVIPCPQGATCLAVTPDVLPQTKGKTPPPVVTIDVQKEDGSASCLPGGPVTTGSQTNLPIDTAICPGKVRILLSNVPGGYCATAQNEFVCVKSAAVDALLPNGQVLCELGTGQDAGDANGDSKIDLKDLGLIKSEFFQTPDKADFNADGKVDLKDLGLVKKYFGLDCQ